MRNPKVTPLIALAWLTALAGAVSCSADETSQTPTEAFCSGLCRAADRCWPSSNSCATACPSSSSADDFSIEGAKHLGDCVASIDCGSLSDETGFDDFFQDCWQSSKKLVPVTEQVRSTCASYVEGWFECGSLYSQADCEWDLRMWSDAILAQVRGCMRSPDCEALDRCLANVFGAS